MKATIILSLILLTPALAMAQAAIDREIASAERDPSVQVVFSEKRDPSTKKIVQESRVVIASSSEWEKRFRKAFNAERPNSVEASVTNQGVYSLTFKTADRTSSYSFVPSDPGCVVSVSAKSKADVARAQKPNLQAQKTALHAQKAAQKEARKAIKEAQKAQKEALKAAKKTQEEANKETASELKTIQGSSLYGGAGSSGIRAIRTEMPRVDRIPDVTAKLRQRNPGSTIQYNDWVKYRTVMGTVVVAPGETIFVPSNLAPRY
ncbi:MAG: DUF5024 domain-containing protein [Bacteroidales bacterium]|nr:DUF5024 domain-containing protein [Bacteroidales bacterium]